MSASVRSKGSKGSHDMNDTVSIASSDDFLFNETGAYIRSDKDHKQKRRGSGLGSLANYFKSNIKKVIANKDQNDGRVSTQFSVDVVPTQVSVVEAPKQLADKTLPQDKKVVSASERSPREFLDVMWRSRGYDRQLYSTLESAYHNKPTPLQVASYHMRIFEMARKGDVSELQLLMKLGISQNPANENGESLLHELCRLGDDKLAGVLISEFGADVQISDSNGRTPLHEACLGGANQPHFAVVDMLADRDSRMFSLKDSNGKTPLDYIPTQQWGAWIDFLYVRRDKYWPRRLVRIDGKEAPPPLTEGEPNSRPLPDPNSALTIDVAGLLVSGDITPGEVAA